MKKLITIVLILAMLLPAAACSESLRVVRHYSLLIDSATTASNSGNMFDFDSLTVDLFITSDENLCYYIETTCIAGIFVSGGAVACRMIERGDTMMLVDESGNSRPIRKDESSGDLWIDIGRGFFRMRLVEPFDIYSDWN